MPSQGTRDGLTALYRVVRTIRCVETSLIKLFADGEVPGFIHLSIGQEAVAAGICAALDDRDTLATTHRGHGHVLARGLDLELFYKEVTGKAGGVCGGRGGSMHVADMDLGILGANGIVGAGIPIALGSALAHQVRDTQGVAVAFFGDGAMAEGVLHETLNMASLWKLPLLLVCENNGWSEFSPTSRQFVARLEDLAGAFKLQYRHVDGNDAVSVAEVARDVVQRIRAGEGPAIIECSTQRVRGHYEGDAQKYRDQDELANLSSVDPLNRLEARMRENGFTAEEIESIATEVEAQVEAAILAARADVEPSFEAALRDVYTA